MEFNDLRLDNEGGWLGWFRNGGAKRLIRCHGNGFKYIDSNSIWFRTKEPVSEEDFQNFNLDNS